MNPFNGEGISLAYETGRLAAESVGTALSTGDGLALQLYPERLEEMYGLYWKVARAFVRAIGNPAVMRELTRVGMQSRTLMEWVLRIMANLLRPDELGPAEAAYKMVAALVAIAPEPNLIRSLSAYLAPRCSLASPADASPRALLGSAAADGGEDGDLVVVVEQGRVAGDGVVAVDPDRGRWRARRRTPGRSGRGRRRAGRRGWRRRTRRSRGRPLRGPARRGAAASRGHFSMLVRAAGSASRRAGSMGSPVFSSMP